MANQFNTNKKTDLVALRAAESAAYLTVGSKAYFGDQLEGKRNGTSYEFVIRDAGEYAEGMDMTGHVSNLVERKVTKDIKLGNILIDTNLLEKVTDVEWDKEIAIPNGKKLINGVVQSTIADDLGQQNTAFVGAGWLPLSKASRFLGSISSDARYGFIDPNIDSIMAAAGKSFDPADVEPLYKKGMLGNGFGTEWRETQFLPSIVITDAQAQAFSGVTVSTFATSEDNGSLYASSIVLSGSIAAPKGTPFFIEGVYACDTVGDKTNSLAAFIIDQDNAEATTKLVASDGLHQGKVYVGATNGGHGTRMICTADGSDVTSGYIAGKKLIAPEAGTYFMGIVRVDGAMEFETLKKLDWSNADQSSDNIEGIKVHEGRAVDVITGSNKTRWAVASLAGIVEPRACALVLVKDVSANLVTL